MEGTIFDYIDWRGDLTFRQSKLNSIDALVFSTLIYLNFNLKPGEEKTIGDIYPLWDALPEKEKYHGVDVFNTDYRKLFDKCAHSHRFANVVVTDFIEETSVENESQFAAATFRLPGGAVFISFRGTDSSLAGWKEDFNMGFSDSTPAQLRATEYAGDIFDSCTNDEEIFLGGHSKGGNLAIWAAVHQSEDERKRIRRVYNNDGPGFSSNLTETPEYEELGKKIVSFVPESSIVGVLMGNSEYLTIKSSSVSVFQHNPFTWKVMGKHFIYDAERSESGKRADKLVNNLFNTLSKEEINEIVDAVYSELVSDNEKTIGDLKKHFLRHLFRNISTIGKFNAKTAEARKKRKELLDQIKKL